MLKCYNCSHEFKHKAVGKYPCGPCQTSCPNCGTYVCPMCGGAMTTEDYDEEDEMRLYTSGHCIECEYSCCGGCI